MLTPIDIHNRQLKPAKIGGYDKKDIDDFIEEIIASYEELYNENRVLKEKITSLSEGIQYYKKMEGTLQKALLLAEKTSTETQEAAKSQADSVLTEASAKAEALTRETKAEIDALRAEAQAQAEVTRAKANRELEETRNHVRKLVQSYENYRLQFKKLAEAQIEMLESDSFSIFVPELDELMKEAPSADNVLDNPGVIPINIGSPAPFEEPPVEHAAEIDSVASSEPAAKQPAKVSVEPVAEVPKKLDVTFDDLSNSIAIPISSNMGPFTDLPVEDNEAGSGAVLQDLKIDSSTAPSIDINIGTAIGEEIEVSMSLDSPSDLNVGAESIDILVNTESLFNGAVEEMPADDPAVQPEAKPIVEPVDISASTPADETAAQAVETPVSILPSFTDPDVIELAPGSEINIPGTTEQPTAELVSPVISVVTPDAVELAAEPVRKTEEQMSAIPLSMESSASEPSVPEAAVFTNPFVDLDMAEPDTAQPTVNLPTESSEKSINADFGMPAEPQGMNIPLSFESPTDISAESQGMNIPLNFESPTDISAEPQGMNIPLNFESPTDISVEPQGMNIPLNFESPTNISAEPQGTNIPISFETPDDLQTTEPQGIHIPVGFEMPEDLQNTDPQDMSNPLGFETPEDLQTTGPQNSPAATGFEIPEDLQTTGPQNVDASLNFNIPQNNMQGVPAMPVMDIPMMETPMPETAQISTNGLIGAEPTGSEANANAMLDMSNFLDSPIKEIPEELQTAASKELTDPAPSENGIISDAFLDPAAMFESPVSEESAAQPEKQPTNANDAMLNINPFNFIDPE